MDKFFDADNPVMKFLARLVDLVILNLITILCSLPLITLGGALTAMNHVLLHYVRGDETYTIRMFRTSFRMNFRQGIAEGLLALAAAIITVTDLWALHGSESRTATFLMILITVIAVLLFVVFVYIFALQSRYENTVTGTIVNAMRLALGNLPKSAVMVIIWGLWLLALIYLNRLASLVFLTFGFSLPGFLCAMLYSGIFEAMEPPEEE